MDFSNIFKKKKPEPVDTALQRERMQPKTIEKLEKIGRELKNAHPRFLGNGHIVILGPVACFIPLSIFMAIFYGPIALLLFIVPAIFAPLFIYLRAKGTEELYSRSDFDLGLFHYKSCKSYVGHGRYIYETVLKATIPYIAFVLVMGVAFITWGNDFSDVNYRNLSKVTGELEYVYVDDEYIAFGLAYDDRIVEGSDDGEKIDIEYRLEKYPEEFDESFFTNVKEGDTVEFYRNRFSKTGKSEKDGKVKEIYNIFSVKSGDVEYFGKEDIENGKKAETTKIIVSVAVFAVYAAACGTALYFADKYAKENAKKENIDLPELI